ncbi:unnamed protein product [Linum tenue]|uniref:Uncharacterized protein n=1 Tax=Linum tenue TaxID=586396 RepID=A0AAV0IY95_9ROSI|nr:unnamed protein product [Linum tenue]
MGDNKQRTVAMARMELEELYSGIPDESVNLTFQDMGKVDQQKSGSMDRSTDRRRPSKPTSGPLQEMMVNNTNRAAVVVPSRIPSLNKIPSLDFNRGLEAARIEEEEEPRSARMASPAVTDVSYDGYNNNNRSSRQSSLMGSPHGMISPAASGRHYQQQGGGTPAAHHYGGSRRQQQYPMSPYDVSGISMATSGGTPAYDVMGKGRRPGIPHSNICTVCSTYIYIFKNRCLVCGRVYCRNCVDMGMGNMPEGRKCIECQGRRFSARYIKKAGTTGCCSRYPGTMKQAELKWAEKGPRKSGEKAYGQQGGGGHRGMKSSGPPTPMSPLTPSRNPPSYLMGSPYSPYSSSHHHLPL